MSCFFQVHGWDGKHRPVVGSYYHQRASISLSNTAFLTAALSPGACDLPEGDLAPWPPSTLLAGASCPEALSQTKHGCQIAIQSPFHDCSCAEDVLKSNPWASSLESGHGVLLRMAVYQAPAEDDGLQTCSIFLRRLLNQRPAPARLLLAYSVRERRTSRVRKLGISSGARRRTAPTPRLPQTICAAEVRPADGANGWAAAAPRRVYGASLASQRESRRLIDYPLFRSCVAFGWGSPRRHAMNSSPGKRDRATALRLCNEYTLLLTSCMPTRACFAFGGGRSSGSRRRSQRSHSVATPWNKIDDASLSVSTAVFCLSMPFAISPLSPVPPTPVQSLDPVCTVVSKSKYTARTTSVQFPLPPEGL